MARKRKNKQQQSSQDSVVQNHPDLMKLAREFNKQSKKMRMKRGFDIDAFNNGGTLSGVMQRVLDIPNKYLRQIEGKNPVVAAGFNLRLQQVRKFSTPSNNPDVPGFRLKLKDESKKPTKKELLEMQEIEQWFCNAGRTDYEGWRRERPDGLLTVMKKFVRERLTIDEVAIEVCKTHTGGPGQFFIYDADTIKAVLPGGYRGKKEDIDPRYHMMGDNFFQMLAEAKLQDMPPVEDIAYVQEIDGRIVAAWTEEDLIFSIANPRTDIKYYKQGWSVLERANSAIVAFILFLKFNLTGIDKSALPKVAMALGQNAEVSDEMIEQFQDEWEANFSGVMGQWKMPILRADAKILDVYKSSRDMEYHKFAEIVAAITLSVMGIDAAEIGLRLNQAQNVLSENSDNRQMFSRDRGLHDMLGDFEGICMSIMSRFPEWDKYTFEITGLNPEDKASKSKLRKEAIESYKTINQARAEEDLPDDPYGDIILNPTYVQYRMQKEQQEQQQDQEGTDMNDNNFEDDDEDDENDDFGQDDDDQDDTDDDDFEIDSLIDKEMGKARTLIRV